MTQRVNYRFGLIELGPIWFWSHVSFHQVEWTKSATTEDNQLDGMINETKRTSVMTKNKLARVTWHQNIVNS